MDLPQLLHHHSQNPSRYVSVSNSSRPHYPDDPNFLNPRPSENHPRHENHQFHNQSRHHHHHVLPPARPQTPPFQPSAPAPHPSPFKAPAVHGYSSGQSEFAFANPSRDRAFEDDRARSSFAHRDFSPSAKVSQHRLVVNDDRPRNRLPEFDLGSRPEFWDQPRVSADNLPARQHQPMSPFKTGNRLRHETESSSRFRVEYGDLVESKHRDELLRGHEHENYYRRGDLVSSPGKSFRDVEFVSVPSLSLRNLESESESYSGRYNKELFRSGRRDGAFENQRRVYDRKVHREGHNSSLERGSAEIVNGNGDVTHFVSGKREYYGPESGRYIRGSKDDFQEFNRAPRKQFQKKSALLRIQKPNYRNTENGQFHHYGYHENSNSSSYRRREQHVHTGNGMDEEETEGSPVELDVSFKSNSLVAKAVVTLTSTSDDIDADLTPRTMKGSDGSVSDKDCSNVEPTQVSGNSINVDGTLCTANAISTFDKERVESDERVNSDVKETCDTGSLNCSSHMKVNSDVKETCDTGSLNCFTSSVAKQSLENNELQRSPEGASLEKADTGACSAKPPVKVVKKKKVVKKIVKKVVRPRRHLSNTELKKQEDSINDKGVASLSHFCSDQVNNVDTGTDIEAAKMTREEQHSIDVTKCLVNTQKNGNRLSTNQASCMQEEAKADKGPEHTESSSKCLLAVSNSDNDFDNLCHVSMPPMIEHVVDDVRQSCQIGDSLSVDISLKEEPSPIMLPIAENVDSALLNSGHARMYDNLTSVFYPANSTDTTLDIVNGTKLLEEETLVREEFSKATSRSSPTSHTTMGVCSPHHDRHRAANNVSNYDENITSSCAAEDCIVKQLSVEGASELPENDTLESSRDTDVIVEGYGGGTPNVRRKRTNRSQLGFSRETNSDLNATIVSNTATSLYTTSNLSSEDPSYEVGVYSMRGLEDGISIVATDTVNFDVASLQFRKRRKVSATQSAPQTDEKNADASASCLQSPLISNDVLVQQQMVAANELMNGVNGISILHNNKLSEGTSDAARSFFEEQKKDDDIVMDVKIQSGRDEKRGECVSEDQDIAQDETQCTIPSASTGMESDNHLMKDNFLNFSNDLSSPDDRSGATSTDEAMDVVPHSLTNRGPPQTLLSASDSLTTDTTSVSQISNKMCVQNKNSDQKSLDESGVYESAPKSFSQFSKTRPMSDCTSASDQTVETNTSLPVQDLRITSQGLNITNVEYNGQKNQHGHTISRTFPGSSSFQRPTLKKTPTATNANARTWHRNAGSSTSLPGSKPFSRTVPSQRQLPARDGKLQSTSYVRKGNSLVRNPSPVIAVSQSSGFSPVYRLNSATLDESKKGCESENKVVAGNLPGRLRVGERKASGCNKPRTSTTQCAKKLPSGTAITVEKFTPSPSAVPLSISDPVSSSENNDTPKLVEDSPASETSENQNGQCNNSDNQTELNEGNLASLNMKRIVYVKRKSNQLVATSNTIDLPVANADKIQTSSFDGYYKRRKNQLIRSSLESHTGQPAFMSDNSLNSGVQMTFNAISSMRLSKRRSQKVFAKAIKHSANSLVWTLRSTQSTKNDCGLSNHQKVFPHLCPWKRTPYWRSVMHNWDLVSKSSRSIPISRKLLLSRKRDTVYTRSINGFSLRKSKVLSVGASSLKWSKSIERHSKKANEEATLAVAAVERKKREQKGTTCIGSESMDRNHSSREKIFRVGSFRYKMDPSRRTLQRISDDESSCAPSTHSDKGAKKSYIPRRLVIGCNEYIRIGNGNQLIRDPKKRTRVLASEKVRWSLHTARLRLARKRKYCQFFTRFGRCNKDSGKCPYLHDPSKIAVCTKFLNGSCSNDNCKLTHKVIPERMPDCSYFLQGLCSNQNCPYRHVNVNPKASSCEGFLRGYCADGDECRKKHSYVCPTFEAKGACPQGSKCKLHHPKNRSHGKKRKRSRELKNVRGRYFGSPDISALDSRTVVSEKFFGQDSNNIFSEGKNADYIAIDVSDDDGGESNYVRSTQITFCESDTSSDLEELEDLDELIKPIRLMNKSTAT